MTLFAFLLICIDFAYGLFMRKIEAYIDTPNYHCENNAEEDILVLGSSFAKRSIDPIILFDSLGLTCYNAGEPGNGIICSYARYNMFVKKHRPYIVVYAITPGYDFYKDGITEHFF